jgi:single-strand DNA-binding protein
MSFQSVVTITGNITNDIELKFSDNGQARTNIRVAVDRNWKNQDNEWQTETSYISVQAWGKVAENIARVTTKGTRIIVIGRLNQRNYEKDGENRSITEIVAEEIGVSTRVIESMERRSLKDDNKTTPTKTNTRTPKNNTDDEPF